MTKTITNAKQKAWIGWHEEGGVLVYATSRGAARVEIASTLGMDLSETFGNTLRIKRAPAGDHLATSNAIPTDSDHREMGFTDETHQRCLACDKGDPSSGAVAAWTICQDCSHCAGCGCEEGCKA